jgi:hypothetical protein
MKRFWRINKEFGFGAFARTCVLLLGLVGMAVYDYVALDSIVVPLIAVVGLMLGSLLRAEIARGAEHYPRLINAGLFVYPIILLLGNWLGLGNGAKLAIIATTTVIIFALQFWSLSDPSVVSAERHAVDE